MSDAPTLAVDGLHVDFATPDGPMHVLRGVSLDVPAGTVVGLVGESGSGKSTIALACMRYLSGNARVVAGDVRFKGDSLLSATEGALTRLRGRRIAMVYQDPNSALNPTLPIGEQVAEALTRHLRLTSRAAWQRAVELLASVNLANPRDAMGKYPHQFSGGEKQRVLIAMAFSCKPELLVLDEPTTALDPTTAASVLDLIRELQQETGVAALYITHNLGTVAEISQQLSVIYAGKIVEAGPTEDVLSAPGHPYTRMLLASIPTADPAARATRLAAFSGQAPDARHPPAGCVFQARCPYVTDACRTGEVGLPQGRHAVACIHYPEIASRPLPSNRAATGAADRSQGQEAIFAAEGVDVYYHRAAAWSLGRRDAGRIHAVRGVGLQLARGETLALVGESGSGKSSLARALVGLETARGSIRLADDAYTLPARLDTGYRQRVQIVFQNPDQSLNPRQTVGTIVARPLAIAGASRSARQPRVRELLEQVRLPAEYAMKYPHQLSGGEKQRVAIARAFATQPDVVICDEVTSALDVSVQASIVNLLADLQAAYGTSYLFISHDLNLVQRFADRVAVMYLGEIVETGRAEQLFHPPYHPYTEALLSAVPALHERRATRKIRLQGVPPSPLQLPPGCPFTSRCPRRLGNLCDETRPPRVSFGPEHWLACHIDEDELTRLPSVYAPAERPGTEARPGSQP